MVKRISLYDGLLQREYEVPLKEEVIVGRSREGTDLAIPYKSGVNDHLRMVSSKHCRLLRHDLGDTVKDPQVTVAFIDLEVLDNQSKNGTYVNGRRIVSSISTALKDDDVLTLGPYRLVVKIKEDK